MKTFLVCAILAVSSVHCYEDVLMGDYFKANSGYLFLRNLLEQFNLTSILNAQGKVIYYPHFCYQHVILCALSFTYASTPKCYVFVYWFLFILTIDQQQFYTLDCNDPLSSCRVQMLVPINQNLLVR